MLSYLIKTIFKYDVVLRSFFDRISIVMHGLSIVFMVFRSSSTWSSISKLILSPSLSRRMVYTVVRY
nr:hypothetical protein Q903MT_gene603 [Picea sitchensis]